MQFRGDMTLLDRLIPWRPQVTLEEGIRRPFVTTKAWKLSGELA